MPPSQRITGPKGPRNRLALPIQRMFRRRQKATISVYGRSQLLVCGAAISTALRACGQAAFDLPAVEAQERGRRGTQQGVDHRGLEDRA
jgi:hypothetical protein